MRVTNVLSAVASTYRDGKPGPQLLKTLLSRVFSREECLPLSRARLYVRLIVIPTCMERGCVSMENRDDMAVEILEVNEQMAILDVNGSCK